MWAFARARPGQLEAPVAVHLVEWGEESRPFTLKLRTAAFFAEKPLAAKLLVPPGYDAPAHRQAEESRDCSALMEAAEVRCTVENQWTVVEIPALDPWGVLVVAAKP